MSLRFALPLLFVPLMCSAFPLDARAHFPWLVRHVDTAGGGVRLDMYFGEIAQADDPDLLDRFAGVEVWRIGRDGARQRIELRKGSDALTGELTGESETSMFVLEHEYGVIERGGAKFLLRYYAKTGPAPGHESWREIDCGKHLDLDLVPRVEGGQVRVTVRWRGDPIAGAQLKATGPGLEDFEANTDKNGQAAFAASKPGVYSIRARHVESGTGERSGEAFAETRHYSTLTLTVPETTAGATPSAAKSVAAYPDIPETVTSFGAAVLDGALYVYGGHTGRAHEYYREAQARTLRRLDLNAPKAWESLGEGPGLQGLAMVAAGGRLYRIGGFVARNADGEEQNLWSSAEVSGYEPGEKSWRELSPLPEPRSSFDAAVLDGRIYVIGGWQLRGDQDSVWHKTAYVLDTSKESPSWEPLPEAPFTRRALSVAAHDGKIFAVGGMGQSGGPTTRVDIYDPATGKWSRGPDIQGEDMEGFGSSAFAVGGRLYVSTFNGNLQRLSEDGRSWEIVKKLERARFFHRMLPFSDSKLLVVGGANMSIGKFEQVEVIDTN